MLGAGHWYAMFPHTLGAEEFPPSPANENSSKTASAGETPSRISHTDGAEMRIILMNFDKGYPTKSA
jgi:hypothetical protein